MNEKFDCFFFAEGFLAFEEGHEVSFIAVLDDEIKVICCFLNIVEFDDISVIASFQHFNLIFKELHELSWSYGLGTFNAFPFDGFDGNVGSVVFVIAFEDITVLAGADFPFEDIVVDDLGHLYND